MVSRIPYITLVTNYRMQSTFWLVVMEALVVTNSKPIRVSGYSYNDIHNKTLKFSATQLTKNNQRLFIDILPTHTTD